MRLTELKHKVLSNAKKVEEKKGQKWDLKAERGSITSEGRKQGWRDVSTDSRRQRDHQRSLKMLKTEWFCSRSWLSGTSYVSVPSTLPTESRLTARLPASLPGRLPKSTAIQEALSLEILPGDLEKQSAQCLKGRVFGWWHSQVANFFTYVATKIQHPFLVLSYQHVRDRLLLHNKYTIILHILLTLLQISYNFS